MNEIRWLGGRPDWITEGELEAHRQFNERKRREESKKWYGMTISTQHLRIGNLVQAEINEMDWQTCTVIGIDIKNVSIETLKYPANTLTLHDSEVHPIPLTEQWLEDFGFEGPAHSWIGDVFHLTGYDKEYGDENSYLVAMNKNNAILRNVRHVHQLQNLFWCLTGQELELKK